MVDQRTDPDFVAAVAATRSAIASLAARGIPDAQAITAREAGENNLQGHANSVLPLAVLFARLNPDVFQALRSATSLNHNMGAGSAEARNTLVWQSVQTRMREFVATHGADIVAEEMKSGLAQSVGDIAATYLSRSYGGTHTRGGAGDTVVKRTLKLLAHTFGL